MKNKIVIGILLATLLVVIVAFSGCIEEYSGYIEEEEIEEVIPISGMDQDITISSDVPVKLVVSGMRNVITVPNWKGSIHRSLFHLTNKGSIHRSVF
jgi:hypothetical protein